MTTKLKDKKIRLDLRSVFIRCAAVMAVTTLVVATVLSVQSARLASSIAVQNVVGLAQKTVNAEAEALVKPMKFKVTAKIEESLSAAMQNVAPDGQAAVVLGADGTVLSQWGASEAVVSDLVTIGAAALDRGVPSVQSDGLLIAQPVQAAEDAPVLGVVVMSFSADAALATVAEQTMYIVFSALAIFALMMGLTLWVLRRLLGKPLAALEASVFAVAEGDYDVNVGMGGRNDEIGQIAQRLETLIARLSEARRADEDRTAHIEAQMGMVDILGQGLNRLADCVLNRQIDDAFPDEYEQLRENFNRAIGTLQQTIGNVSSNADNILASAQEISRASDDLSQRTETQAATLEQSAAALEALQTSVNDSAQNADKVDKAVQDARGIAARNGEIMNEAIGAMGEIEKSSDQISDIISVIDDIAFQTNLLALNAGVEAARAGSSGKGFAVVASEVQGLAQRSAEAAQQIKDLIIGSAQQVQNGVKLVERAGSALEEMVEQVTGVSYMVSDIAKGAGAQAQGLNEINVGIANLDRVTQQNAAMVEEATAAAHTLREDATKLRELVTEFVTVNETPTGFAPEQPGTTHAEAVA